MSWTASHVTNQITIDKFYSFFEAHRDKDFHFPGEAHNFWECVYVLDGRICVSGDEHVYSLSRHGIIFHKPMEFHKYFVESENGADLLIFSFSLEGQLSDMIQNKVFYLSENQQQIVRTMLNYARRKAAGIQIPKQSKYEHRYLLPFDRIPGYSQLLTTYVYQLILSLTGDGNSAAVSDAPDALIFGNAISYMNSQLSSQPSIAEIAFYCNTSEATLKRIFDKYAGIGIHKYFLKLKMNTAAELLQNGATVTEAAEQLGFSSQAYFSAAFKREMGIKPSEV